MPQNTDRTMTYAEKLGYITDVLTAMGYRIISYDEPNGVSLSGYDDAMNYVELLDLDIFTVDDAVKWVTTVWMARSMALKAGMEEVQARFDGLSEYEQHTLRDGIARLIAERKDAVEAAQTAIVEDVPVVVADVPESVSTLLLEMFTSVDAANDWLDTPARYLGERIPRELLTEEGGIQQVESALEALGSGVFI